MTARTITSPYDPQTLSEIQARIVLHLGSGTWSSGLSSTAQTDYQRVIDASADWLAQRYPHAAWLIHEESLSLANGTATLSLSNAARRVVRIKETYDGKTRLVKLSTKQEADYDAWRQRSDTHPWDDQEDPRWFVDAMTDDNPPKIQLKRIPTPDAAVTGTALVRPYLTLIGSSGDQTYRHIPAEAEETMMSWIFSKIHALRDEYEKSQFWRAAAEDDFNALDLGQTDSLTEAPRAVELPDDFYSELGL